MKGKVKDITGMAFGKLTVLSRDKIAKSGCMAWKCLCSCGKTTIISGANLRAGRSKTCGCSKTQFVKDETGNKYGRLLVISQSDKIQGKDSGARWTCLCDCGNTVVAKGTDLRYGAINSCGCLQRDLLSAKTKEKNPNWKGGAYVTKGGYVHTYQPDHLRTNSSGYAYEHVLVMEKMLGHALPEGMVVHHCNGDKTDNRPYNLRLFKSQSEHAEYHMKLRGIGG